MTRPRVTETDQGIQGEFTVTLYDQMQRRLRDKGWIETKDIIKSGITKGIALEIGPGPGYLGLEWLKNGVCQGSCRVSEFHVMPSFVVLMNRPFELLTD